MRVAFMGTPDFAVPALEALIRGLHDVVCVYTQPPRPKGRGQKVQPSPVHLVAEAHGIPVYHPVSLKKDEEARAVFAGHDLDVAVVAAYGLILPQDVLDAPRHGCLNIHASLLPRWRGASPIQRAVWAGDTESGVSIMQMDIGLDTGAVVSMRAVPIRPVTTAQSLHDELAALGGVMMAEALDTLARDGVLPSKPQPQDGVTYAHLLRKDDGKIDWNKTAPEIDRQVRALNPWPGVWTIDEQGRRLKILAVDVVNERFTETPGTLVDRGGHVACGNDTCLRLRAVQPENAKVMDFSAAVNGSYLNADLRFY